LRATLPKLIEQTQQKWLGASIENFQKLRQSTLSYVASNHRAEFGIGAYSYLKGGPPVLYASCYAALIRHLYDDLNQLSDTERIEWTEYLQKYQADDGLFRDPLIDCPQAESVDWWGWRHLTLHVLMALTALGETARKLFCSLYNFRTPGRITEWLENRNWKQDAACVSNEIQSYAVMMQYARDFQNQCWCDDAMDEMYRWLDRHQDPQTGYWGYGSQTAWERSQGVQTGYHLWLLYFYDGRPVQYIEKIIDSCLATQNKLGGFGVSLNSSACEDIDSIYPLVRLSFITNYREQNIQSSLRKVIPWVLANMNRDGGFVFRRMEPLVYGHELMSSKKDESAMFPTWFRTLSLAYIGKCLPDSLLGKFNWQFIGSPGLQFWHD
jgi:hypothetical protein